MNTRRQGGPDCDVVALRHAGRLPDDWNTPRDGFSLRLQQVCGIDYLLFERTPVVVGRLQICLGVVPRVVKKLQPVEA